MASTKYFLSSPATDRRAKKYILDAMCDREILFGLCVLFADPYPYEPKGFEGTIFSWLGAWGTKEGGETLKSS